MKSKNKGMYFKHGMIVRPWRLSIVWITFTVVSCEWIASGPYNDVTECRSPFQTLLVVFSGGTVFAFADLFANILTGEIGGKKIVEIAQTHEIYTICIHTSNLEPNSFS